MKQMQEVVLDDRSAGLQFVQDDLSLAVVRSLAVTHADSRGLSDKGYTHLHSAPL